MSLAIAYSISDLPGCAGAKLQTTQGTVDRPLAAQVAAWASRKPLMGMLAGADEETQYRAWLDFLAETDVPADRVIRWCEAIRGKKWGMKVDPRVGDLVLHDYQIDAINNLSCAGGLLGLFMGAGKTAIGIAVIQSLKVRSWVFCPLNAAPEWESWRSYVEERCPGIEYRVLSIDSAHKYIGAANTGGVLIVDEAHGAGSVAARRTQSLHAIRARFDYGLCLTGSAATGGVEKCLSMKDLAVPGLTGFSSKWKAGEHFRCLVKKRIGSRVVTSLEEPSTQRDAFMEWLGYQSTLLRPRAESVKVAFQLPEQDIQDVKFGEPWLPLDQEVARIAKEIHAETGEFPHAQAVLHALAGAGCAEKVEFICEELAGSSEPLVCFAQYRSTLDALCEALEAAGHKYTRVDGDVVGEDRAACQRKFQSGEVRVFVGQAHAASVAMNLQRACHSVSLDFSSSATDYEQLRARTCRQGQKYRCLHLDLVFNHLQAAILRNVREGGNFNAQCSEYQELKRATEKACDVI